jgi:hypothetical protein
MQDAAFLADMAKQKLPVNPLTGKEAKLIATRSANVPPRIASEAKAIYN